MHSRRAVAIIISGKRDKLRLFHYFVNKQEMYWAAEGYLWEKIQREDLDFDQMESDFLKLIEFWKSVYLRKEV